MLNQISPVTIKDGVCYHKEQDIEFANPPVYEVIRVVDGCPLYFSEHANRLLKSLKLNAVSVELNQTDILAGIDTLVTETGILNNNVRLEVGEDLKGISTWVLFWVKSQYPEKNIYEQGVKVVTSYVTRDNPHAKIYRKQYVEKINALKQETGAFEVILIKDDGIVTEGSRSNLFFILEGKLYSASEEDVLMGITRQKLIALLNALSIEVVEMDIPLNTIHRFEACFITGTSIHLLPVNAVDDIKFSTADHPLFKKLATAFDKIVKDNLEHTKEAILR